MKKFRTPLSVDKKQVLPKARAAYDDVFILSNGITKVLTEDIEIIFCNMVVVYTITVKGKSLE